MALSFFQGVFSPIAFRCILPNILCITELSSEYWHLFSNCCLRYCAVEQFSTSQRVLIVETFHEHGGNVRRKQSGTCKPFLAEMKLRASLHHAD